MHPVKKHKTSIISSNASTTETHCHTKVDDFDKRPCFEEVPLQL